MVYSKARRQYYLIYTLLFIFLTLVIFSGFILKKKTLIWTYDGWYQHYKALVYYGNYLRTIFRNIFIFHEWNIPEWEFALGEGSDIVETLQYYVVGDPFAFLSVFVPSKYTYILYSFLIILRMYLAGIVFSMLCFYTKQKNQEAVLAGSMVYVFCFWCIYNAERHPYFLNPMIYLPLLIIGIEMVLRKERPYLLVGMVALCGLSNFYFYYVLALLSVIYVVLRLAFTCWGRFKEALAGFWRFFISCLCGSLLSAVLLFPMAYAFINSPRSTGTAVYHVFYPVYYYMHYIKLFVTPSESFWMCMGFAAPVLLAVIWLFLPRNSNMHFLRCLFIICIVFSMFPVFGQAFNGFSYMTNRWCFAFALLSSYLLTRAWPTLLESNRRTLLWLVIGICGYLALYTALGQNEKKIAFAQIGIDLVFLFLVYCGKLKSGNRLVLRKIAPLFLLCVSICLNGIWHYYLGEHKYVEDAVGNVLASRVEDNETLLVKKTAQADGMKEFYRYTGKGLARNAGLLSGISSTQFYWTISSPYISQFRSEVQMDTNSLFDYFGYDDRAALLALASVKYDLLSSGTDYLPYSYEYKDYEKLDDESIMPEEDIRSGFWIYSTQDTLPLAYTFSSYMAKENWLKLSAVERQEAMLQMVVLEDYQGKNLYETEPVLTDVEQKYSIDCGSGVSVQGNTFLVTEPGASVRLSFDPVLDSELYVTFEGLLFEPQQWDYKKNGTFEGTTIKMVSSNDVHKSCLYLTEDSSLYGGRHDFSFCMNYSEEGDTSVEIWFEHAGLYSFDELRVTCQPMESYRQHTRQLRETTLQDVYFGTDEIRGRIDVTEPRFLFISMPWSAGWKAYVDEVETKIYRADTMRMAIELEPGSHELHLVYHSPYLREGMAVSMLMLILFILYVILYENRQRKNV